MNAPRVLIIVRDGNADYVGDIGVDVEIFDWDNYNANPERTGALPTHFADLAAPLCIPCEET